MNHAAREEEMESGMWDKNVTLRNDADKLGMEGVQLLCYACRKNPMRLEIVVK